MATGQLGWKLVLLLLRIPLFALYGAWRVALSLLGAVGELRAAKRLLAEALPCPSCSKRNLLAGRWTCAACSGVYHGYVGECPVCGAGAAFFPCERCGISIPMRSRS